MPRRIGNTIVPRNQVAQSPLMKKGGVHKKNTTAKRRQVREEIETELEDWREAMEFELSVAERAEDQ